MSEPSPFIAEQFPPIAYRVSWRHHTAKLVSLKRQPEQFRDFATAEEARDYAKAMQVSYPHSVVSSKPLHVTHPKRNAKNDARQHDIGELVPLPLQRKPKR